MRWHFINHSNDLMIWWNLYESYIIQLFYVSNHVKRLNVSENPQNSNKIHGQSIRFFERISGLLHSWIWLSNGLTMLKKNACLEKGKVWWYNPSRLPDFFFEQYDLLCDKMHCKSIAELNFMRKGLRSRKNCHKV